MGKPKGKNGFFYYMQHKQQELKREGQNWGINDPRLQQIAGDEWKAMNKEEREPFDRRAKSEKERSKNTIEVMPKSYNQRQAENFNKTRTIESINLDNDEDKEEYLDKIIECCVKACKTNEDLMNASFFVIASNVMTHTDKEWIPLEIGITQYSIKEGIHYCYHQFIDGGSVPMGYMHSAKSWAEDTHKIPLDNFYPASDNYRKIVEDIAQVLDNSRFTNEITGKPTPMLIFCKEEQIQQNKGVMEWLANKYRSFAPSFEWDLEVLDLVNLLFHISNAVGQPIPPAIAEDYLSTSAFDYSANTNCEFHEEMDNKNCAKGQSRRYCYMLSQALCALFEIQFTDKHLPPKRDNIIADSYKATLQEVKSIPTQDYRYKTEKSTENWAPQESQPLRPESSRSQSRLMGVGRGRGFWKQ